MDVAVAHRYVLPLAGPAAAGARQGQPVRIDRTLPPEFFMYKYKVIPCPNPEAHNWEQCMFAHAGEKARRRNPSNYHAVQCPEARAKTVCPRGEDCPCTHSLFEYWLHPERFRTCMCEHGVRCQRPLCFFAHTPEEVRPLPEGTISATSPPPQPPQQQQQARTQAAAGCTCSASPHGLRVRAQPLPMTGYPTGVTTPQLLVSSPASLSPPTMTPLTATTPTLSPLASTSPGTGGPMSPHLLQAQLVVAQRQQQQHQAQAQAQHHARFAANLAVSMPSSPLAFAMSRTPSPKAATPSPRDANPPPWGEPGQVQLLQRCLASPPSSPGQQLLSAGDWPCEMLLHAQQLAGGPPGQGTNGGRLLGSSPGGQDDSLLRAVLAQRQQQQQELHEQQQQQQHVYVVNPMSAVPGARPAAPAFAAGAPEGLGLQEEAQGAALSFSLWDPSQALPPDAGGGGAQHLGPAPGAAQALQHQQMALLQQLQAASAASGFSGFEDEGFQSWQSQPSTPRSARAALVAADGRLSPCLSSGRSSLEQCRAFQTAADTGGSPLHSPGALVDAPWALGAAGGPLLLQSRPARAGALGRDGGGSAAAPARGDAGIVRTSMAALAESLLTQLTFDEKQELFMQLQAGLAREMAQQQQQQQQHHHGM